MLKALLNVALPVPDHTSPGRRCTDLAISSSTRYAKIDANDAPLRVIVEEDGNVSVRVTSPATGSKVYQIDRKIKYDVEKPRLSSGDLHADFIKKYGTPTVDFKRGFRTTLWVESKECTYEQNPANFSFDGSDCEVFIESRILEETRTPKGDGNVGELFVRLKDLRQETMDKKELEHVH